MLSSRVTDDDDDGCSCKSLISVDLALMLTDNNTKAKINIRNDHEGNSEDTRMNSENIILFFPLYSMSTANPWYIAVMFRLRRFLYETNTKSTLKQTGLTVNLISTKPSTNPWMSC